MQGLRLLSNDCRLSGFSLRMVVYSVLLPALIWFGAGLLQVDHPLEEAVNTVIFGTMVAGGVIGFAGAVISLYFIEHSHFHLHGLWKSVTALLISLLILAAGAMGMIATVMYLQ